MYDTQLFIVLSRRYKNQIYSSCVTGFVPWIIPSPIPPAPTPAPPHCPPSFYSGPVWFQLLWSMCMWRTCDICLQCLAYFTFIHCNPWCKWHKSLPFQRNNIPACEWTTFSLSAHVWWTFNVYIFSTMSIAVMNNGLQTSQHADFESVGKY